ncbi:hypothetical protein SAMN05428947_11957 [Mucilaginibacter sp. OK283]|jgi:hypothetical protein|nr:hypothetical protein SAMN05428947_11957 [Mucilaginibacter sp. OK283]
MGYLFLFKVLTEKLLNHSLKKLNMKNSFKLGLVALAIATSFAACKGSGSSSAADSAKMDTAKMDTAKADSAKTDTAKTDTTKKDTTKKM